MTLCVANSTSLAQLAADAVAARPRDEEALQPLRRDVGDVGVRVERLARGGDRLLVEVGGEHLDCGLLERRAGVLGQQHGDRVGLLAGGAAGTQTRI